MKYRPEIDGLRAIAVIPVIFFHAGFVTFSGGFIGVDVFFVISGYLITTILLKDLNEGTLSLAKFYERRARRILPALFFVTLICIPFAWFFMLPEALENFGQSVVATVLFSNNVLLNITAGYWDLASEFKPLLHTWSLGVEEQFYFFFPLIILLAFRFGIPAVYAACLTILIVSFSLVLSDGYISQDGKFYLLFTRAWELMLGAVCAVYKVGQSRGISRSISELMAVIGLMMIAFAVLEFDESTPFPSSWTIIPTLGTLLVLLYATSGTSVNRLLSWSPFVGIGLISYSAYLWHQPLFAFARIFMRDDPGAFLMGLLSFLSIVLAYFSWRLVENPFRSGKSISTKTALSTLLCAGAVLIFFGISAHQSSGFPGRIFESSIGRDDLYIGYNERVREYAKNSIEARKFSVLVVGDSFARDVANMVLETTDESDVELIYTSQRVCEFSELSSAHFFWGAQVIFFARNRLIGSSGGNLEASRKCVGRILEKSEINGSKVYFFGPKHFGRNLNWISRLSRDERALLVNPIPRDVLELEELVKKNIPPENYISILDEISHDGTVLFTDENGDLLSGDRIHLTRKGAKFLGNRILRRTSVCPYLIDTNKPGC